MTVFWKKGYEGASLSDLTTAMGINAPSLYAAFGSKEGLFKAVLERYDARRSGFMERVLSADDAYGVARNYLEGIAEFAADTNGGANPPGCLLVQNGSCSDATIPEEVARHRAEKERLLCERFDQARKDGDLPRDADPSTLARYLSAMANGICMHAAAGATVAELMEIAQMALASWPMQAKAVKKKKPQAAA
ncbi:MAG TPA: TetR/AcrR family transcriptional regulator [Rhizomicrobium sp.]|nr:TetR/AcrR family transcriptional regulator [Rhizomicrobium sp.]